MNIQKSATVLRNHEQHIANNGAVPQQIAQFITAHQRNENKSLWIVKPMFESLEQSYVLQQHRVGLQAFAQGIKPLMNQQQPTTSWNMTYSDLH